MKKIAFLGCGSMGEAILAGYLAAGADPQHVTATVRRVERAAELATRHSIVAIAGAEEPDANKQAAQGADVVVLGVKPVNIKALCEEISSVLAPGAVVVSVAAAVSLDLLRDALPAGQPVIRTIPNTPLTVGRGVVGLSPSAGVTADQLALGKSLFDGAGTVLEVPEEQLDAISAISGSGPAYAFYLAEAMAAAAREFGLDEETAVILGRETVAGAGLMLTTPGADPAVLRRGVTSPNGTTAAAVAVFDAQELPAIISAGAKAAAARAAEITAQLRAG
ncbi:MAG: pyrroline-5-carboxylate reductase [Acidobacteria bacterium]|nr:pyrroline-5-carboxylate reductase [Acidobacteriota bacterium]